MGTEYKILIIIFIHWVGDFLFQTSNMALNKSKSIYWLFAHVFAYSLTWMLIGSFIFTPIQVNVFCLITFASHFITDYITSRWTRYLYLNKKFYGFPSFFSVIGLDQIFHYVQLVFTYKFVTESL